ncbi:MAG TPA: family 16 glycoside hydrolase [Candidatus Paceibacterota bacterium]|nr:family 16 glycoside hydrolase [Candidatus Paceibacterota bacterium]
MKPFFWLGLMLLAFPGFAAERVFDFSNAPADQVPAGFRNLVFGAGKVGDWKVVQDEAPAIGSSVSNALALIQRSVLGQTSHEPRSSRLPILLFDQEAFGDFRLTSRFKLTGGVFDQAAGIVFRFQNESNFYFVQASAVENKFRCYKVENGVVKPPIGPDLEVKKGVWHTLTVQCEGTRILCGLDGNDAIKLIDNTARKSGKIGFCTKADTTGEFVDLRIAYTPHEPLARALVKDALKEFPRVLGLKIFAVRNGSGTPTIVASNDEKELGQSGGKTEQDVITGGNSYFGRGKDSVTVTMPLRDRNGDPVAAVCVVMKSFPGQTEDNAMVRAQPIISLMQPRVLSLEMLLE